MTDSVTDSVLRTKVRFVSGGVDCVGSYYPGTNGGCVIMAAGFAVTKEPGTDRFAQRFAVAGFNVLAFDYRHLGESGGQPRQVVSARKQLADWDSAITVAGTLPGVDAERLAVWGFSSSGGHIFRVAAAHPELAAAIAQSPNADGWAAARNAAKHQKPLALLRFAGCALIDAFGPLVGRPPLLVALEGPPGTVAALTTPDAIGGGQVLDPDGRYPNWQQAVAARSALQTGFSRPGRAAREVRIPLQVVVCDGDRSALVEPSVVAAEVAPHGELVMLPGGHYASFLAAHQAAVDAEVDFLRRHLLSSTMAAATDTGDHG